MTNSERLRLIQNIVNETWMCSANESTSFYRGIILSIDAVLNTESDECEPVAERIEKHNSACLKTNSTSVYEENDVDDPHICSVCGGVPRVRTIDSEDRTYYYVECADCASSTTIFESRREAVNVWNRGNR